MKLSVPKIRLAASVGICLTETQITWCVLEKTLFGTRQAFAGEQPCVKQDWAIALNNVLERLKEDVGPGAAIVIGLPAGQTFFVTLPVGAKVQSAEALLTDHHCCSSIPPQELSADMSPLKLNGKSFAAVGASRRKDLQVLTDVPRKLGFRLVRVEPAPWAMLRVAKPLKGNKVAMRLLLVEQHMVAALVCGPQPLLWRTLELPRHEPEDEIVSLVRTFETYATNQLGLGGIEEIVLEGPGTGPLGRKLSMDLGARFRAIDGIGPTAQTAAKGLAAGGLTLDGAAPDLARSIAPPPQLWDLVPRGECALLCALVVCMALWLYAQGTIGHNKAKRLEEDNARNVLLKKNDDAKLKDQKKLLTAEVQAVNAFFANRVLWTEYLNQITSKIPPGVKMASVQGDYEMSGADKNGKKPKRSLVIGFATLLPPNMSAPPEVDQILAGIRSCKAITREFPDVKLGTLRVNKNVSGQLLSGDPATFTVACNPKAKEKVDKDKAAAGDKAVAKSE